MPWDIYILERKLLHFPVVESILGSPRPWPLTKHCHLCRKLHRHSPCYSLTLDLRKWTFEGDVNTRSIACLINLNIFLIGYIQSLFIFYFWTWTFVITMFACIHSCIQSGSSLILLTNKTTVCSTFAYCAFILLLCITTVNHFMTVMLYYCATVYLYMFKRLKRFKRCPHVIQQNVRWGQIRSQKCQWSQV